MNKDKDSFTSFSIYMTWPLFKQLDQCPNETGRLAKMCQALYPVYCETQNASVLVAMNDQILAFLNDKVNFGKEESLRTSKITWVLVHITEDLVYQRFFWVKSLEQDPLWNYSLNDGNDVVLECGFKERV